MCEQLSAAMNKQWLANPWSKQDNPRAAIAHYLWARGSATPADNVCISFRWACFGQRRKPELLQAYQGCWDQGPKHFFTSLTLAHERCADFDEIREHLEWQAHSDMWSITTFLDAAGQSDIVRAMHLLSGPMGHHQGVLELYRAAAAASFTHLVDAAGGLRRRAETGRLHHPYLAGAEPSPLGIEQRVPQEGA